VLTKDQRLRYRLLEIAALRASKASVRPDGRKSPGHRYRGGFPGRSAADLQSPPFHAWTVRCPRFTIWER
jgi:hypothetical protein